MLPIEIRVGYIFRYSYLWHRQHLEGREEGDKDRPCLVLASIKLDDGSFAVRALPVTHAPPDDPADAIEIPRLVKERFRLDEGRSWIVVTESNRFVWPGPDLRPVESETGYYGAIPPAIFAEAKRRFVALAKAHSHASVQRTA
jgi:hypothetical protein